LIKLVLDYADSCPEDPEGPEADTISFHFELHYSIFNYYIIISDVTAKDVEL